MKHFKEKLEIETLKAMTYTEINKLLNELTKKNDELTEQLRLCGVGVTLPSKLEKLSNVYIDDSNTEYCFNVDGLYKNVWVDKSELSQKMTKGVDG